MSAYLKNPVVRLALRAVLVGLTVGLTNWNTNGIWKAAVAAGVLAAAEVFTPLNQLVGLFKTAATKAAK